MDTTNYCLDSLSSRRASHQPYGASQHHSNTDSDQVLSPPLTPALSPSVTMSSHSFKRKFSTDPTGYPAPNYPSTSASASRLGFDNSIERRTSTCSAMSVDEYQQHPYWANVHMDKQRSMSFSDRTSCRRQPSKQNKHICTYPHCGWSFKRYEHLKRHMLVHTGERPHACPYPGCGKRFSRSDNFHAHYRTHTKKALEQQKRTSTSMAQSPTAYDTGFQRTMMSDQERFSFQPRMRPMMPDERHSSMPLYNRASYDNGVPFSPERDRQHPGMVKDNFNDNPPSSASPSTSSALALGGAPCASLSCSSDDDKQHVCSHSDCQRRFKRLEHLKRHMRIHTLERPFQCTYAGCQKTFSRSDNLTQHLKTHERRESRYHHRVMHDDPHGAYSPQPSSNFGEPMSFVDFMRPSSSSSATHHSHNNGHHHAMTASVSTPSPYGQASQDSKPKDESNGRFHNHNPHHHHHSTSPPSSSSMHMLGWHPGDAAGSIGC